MHFSSTVLYTMGAEERWKVEERVSVIGALPNLAGMGERLFLYGNCILE